MVTKLTMSPFQEYQGSTHVAVQILDLIFCTVMREHIQKLGEPDTTPVAIWSGFLSGLLKSFGGPPPWSRWISYGLEARRVSYEGSC